MNEETEGDIRLERGRKEEKRDEKKGRQDGNEREGKGRGRKEEIKGR